jgi:dsDNA-specific endonuclease/ATPase MutS2
MEDMMIDTETVRARIVELKQNHERIEQELQKLETARQQGNASLLVVSGGIQVLEELLAREASNAAPILAL